MLIALYLPRFYCDRNEISGLITGSRTVLLGFLSIDTSGGVTCAICYERNPAMHPKTCT